MKKLRDWAKKSIGLDIKVLAIGGSDPGGGAGIQQDIRTITALGAYGTGVPTALTIQNTQGVEAVLPVEATSLKRQLQNCLMDIRFDALKLGMLATKENLDVICEVFSDYPPVILVVDPVFSSKNHSVLLEEEGIFELIEKIGPYATVITPNIPEAKRLLGLEPEEPISQEGLSKRLFERAAQKAGKEVAIIVKGGHGDDDSLLMDILCHRDGVFSVGGMRVKTPHTHGTGCAYSSSLATFLGAGIGLKDAMKLCREFMEVSLLGSAGMGTGIGPVNTLAPLKQTFEKEFILEELSAACAILEGHPESGRLAPEIQINLGFALSFARSKEDVAAFPGRIVRVGKRLTRVRAPAFGASSHVANIILTAMRFDPRIRSAMDIRMDKGLLERAQDAGMSVAFFSRKEEPKDVKEREGSSLSWGVKKAILENRGRVPDLIWDDGDWGKEPAIRVLGKDPGDVVKKALSLL